MLQKHYANLQALALDRDAVEAIPDYIMPDVEGFSKVCFYGRLCVLVVSANMCVLKSVYYINV